MKKLIVVFMILILFSIIAFAELSNETKLNVEILRAKYVNEEVESIEKLIEKLKFKLYTLSAVINFDDILYYDGIAISTSVIELVDIPINVLTQVKGWEIWINNECYYILLIEKED